MNGVMNTVGTALTVVFVVAVAVLVAQIFYVLWRRRRFSGRSLSSTGGIDFTGTAGDDHNSFYTTPSKELLYFFCLKNHQVNRVEPDGNGNGNGASAPAVEISAQGTDAEVDEVMKWQCLYGLSRGLFTIREDEREEEAEAESNNNNNNNLACAPQNDAFKQDIKEVVIEFDETTPFSTPCGSPPYYTPSPSPPRDGDGVVFVGIGGVLPGDDNTVSFVSVEVHSL